MDVIEFEDLLNRFTVGTDTVPGDQESAHASDSSLRPNELKEVDHQSTKSNFSLIMEKRGAFLKRKAGQKPSKIICKKGEKNPLTRCIGLAFREGIPGIVCHTSDFTHNTLNVTLTPDLNIHSWKERERRQFSNPQTTCQTFSMNTGQSVIPRSIVDFPLIHPFYKFNNNTGICFLPNLVINGLVNVTGVRNEQFATLVCGHIIRILSNKLVALAAQLAPDHQRESSVDLESLYSQLATLVSSNERVPHGLVDEISKELSNLYDIPYLHLRFQKRLPSILRDVFANVRFVLSNSPHVAIREIFRRSITSVSITIAAAEDQRDYMEDYDVSCLRDLVVDGWFIPQCLHKDIGIINATMGGLESYQFDAQRGKVIEVVQANASSSWGSLSEAASKKLIDATSKTSNAGGKNLGDLQGDSAFSLLKSHLQYLKQEKKVSTLVNTVKKRERADDESEFNPAELARNLFLRLGSTTGIGDCGYISYGLTATPALHHISANVMLPRDKVGVNDWPKSIMVVASPAVFMLVPPAEFGRHSINLLSQGLDIQETTEHLLEIVYNRGLRDMHTVESKGLAPLAVIMVILTK